MTDAQRAAEAIVEAIEERLNCSFGLRTREWMLVRIRQLIDRYMC